MSNGPTRTTHVKAPRENGILHKPFLSSVANTIQHLNNVPSTPYNGSKEIDCSGADDYEETVFEDVDISYCSDSV